MPKTQTSPPKLNDTQLVILSAAAQRGDHALLPFPQSLTVKGAAVCTENLNPDVVVMMYTIDRV
jgi:hypothetical protein